MAKKKSKAKKRLMGKSKRTVAKKKAVKRKARPAKSSSKAKTVAKKAAKPARKKVKAKTAPTTKKISRGRDRGRFPLRQGGADAIG